MTSIIVPVYNVERYLKECLDSLINQTNGNLEIIAVNDGSTDNSAAILDDYSEIDQRIKVIYQSNKGLSGARNTGIDHASGEYIIFVDSDDIVHESLVQKCVETFNSNDSEIIVFNHECFDGNTREKRIKKIDSGTTTSLNFLKHCINFKTNTWYPVWHYGYKKDFLINNKLKFYEGILHEDILFTPQAIVFSERITVISDVLYYYRNRLNSITTDPLKVEKSLKDHVFIAESLFHFSKNIKSFSRRKIIQNIVAKRYQFIIEKCKKKNVEYANKVYSQVVSFLRKRKELSELFNKDFYELHIETKVGRNMRLLAEQLLKWPRRIYKYQIKPKLK